MHRIIVVVMTLFALVRAQQPVSYLPLHTPLTGEDSLAVEWLRQQGMTAQVVNLSDVAQLPGGRVLWIHRTKPESPFPTDNGTLLREFYEHGGKLLLTGAAAQWVTDLGLEPRSLETRLVTVADPDFYHKRGLQSYRGHPLFAGLFGGTYLWQPTDSATVWRTGYFANRPAAGRVVAIEKAYVRFLPDTILAWEYGQPSGGQCVAIGAYVQFGLRNVLDYRMSRMLKNAFAYLNGQSTEAVTHWPPPVTGVPERIAPPESRLGIPRAQDRLLERIRLRPLHLEQVPATSNFWDVGGQEILIMGKQAGGIDEVWAFPYRIVQHWQISLWQNGRALPLDSSRVRFVQLPEAVHRVYATPEGELREIIYAHRNAPGMMVHYQWNGKDPVTLRIQFGSDLRWFWPYREDARANIQYAFDDKRQAFYYRTADNDIHVFVGADVAPQSTIIGPYRSLTLNQGKWQGENAARNAIRAGAEYVLNDKNEFTVNIAVAAGRQSFRQANGVYRAMLANPQEVYRHHSAYYDSLLSASIQLETPDERFNEGYQWALVALDRFNVRTPGIGSGVMAGFGTTARGWDGGHAVSGRPGYAWYFGRDAAWAALALIANGDTTNLRNQLQLFVRYQDKAGKVFHELTPNGVVHYDAADATPLFVILAGWYVQATGDTAFLRTIWPAVTRAMHFLESTDTDGDGLINNYQVGHGWVEGGPLFGGKTTFYLAGLWQATLQHAAEMAEVMGDSEDGQRWQRQAQRVAKILEERFYLSDKQFYAQSISRTNEPLKELSILPAAVLNVTNLPAAHLARMMMVYPSTAFTTDWGARILSQYSPHYNPKGYHSGSVWPLFTGWLALAEYRYGNDVQAFQHLNQTLRLYRHQALGTIEEVLHGERFVPMGVCAHQAWSESALLNPIYYGMLGLEPHALGDTMYLTPRLPGNWENVVVRNIRLGDTRFDLEIKQGEKRIEYKFSNVVGAPITVMLNARMPLAAQLKKVTGLRENRSFTVTENGFLQPAIPIHLAAEKTVKIKIHFKGGVFFFPAGPNLQEGQESRGLRILSIRQQGQRFFIDVECKGGHDQYLGVHTFRSAKIRPVKGAFLEPGLKRMDYWLKILSPKFTHDYLQKTVIVDVVME